MSGNLCDQVLRSCPTRTECEKDLDKAGFHDLKRVNNQAMPNFASITNKNVRSCCLCMFLYTDAVARIFGYNYMISAQ